MVSPYTIYQRDLARNWGGCGCGRGNGEGGEVRESVAVLGVLLCCVTTKQLELVTAAACGAAAAAAEGDE